MTGRIIREGHLCERPTTEKHQVGTIWQCDCRRYWRLTGSMAKPTWLPMSFVEVAFAGLAARQDRSQ